MRRRSASNHVDAGALPPRRRTRVRGRRRVRDQPRTFAPALRARDALLVGNERSPVRRLPRRRVGASNRRRRAVVREARARRFSVRSFVAHHPAETRALSTCLSGFRSGAGGTVRRARRGAPPCRSRDRPSPRQDRGGDPECAARCRRSNASWILCGLHLALCAHPARTSTAPRSRAAVPAMTAASIALAARSPTPRISFRRADDRLRIHAGDGAGERSSGRLRQPGRVSNERVSRSGCPSSRDDRSVFPHPRTAGIARGCPRPVPSFIAPRKSTSIRSRATAS